MLKVFYPDVEIDSAYSIDYAALYKEGFRGIIYDIDNTLVRHGAPADERAVLLFKNLDKLGFKSLLLSNNKENRVKMFNKDINTMYIYKANKPYKEGYIKAMEKMGTNKDNTIFVGDQLFTDIFGAKRVGIKTFLVKPIHPKEEIQIVLKRKLEKIVLYFYHRSLKTNK